MSISEKPTAPPNLVPCHSSALSVYITYALENRPGTVNLTGVSVYFFLCITSSYHGVFYSYSVYPMVNDAWNVMEIIQPCVESDNYVHMSVPWKNIELSSSRSII